MPRQTAVDPCTRHERQGDAPTDELVHDRAKDRVELDLHVEPLHRIQDRADDPVKARDASRGREDGVERDGTDIRAWHVIRGKQREDDGLATRDAELPPRVYLGILQGGDGRTDAVVREELRERRTKAHVQDGEHVPEHGSHQPVMPDTIGMAGCISNRWQC